jgi:hypothetical protein
VSAVSDNAGKLDALKWLVALAVLVAGLYANAEYATLTLLYRVLAGIVIAGVFVAIALTTQFRAEPLGIWPKRRALKSEKLFGQRGKRQLKQR